MLILLSNLRVTISPLSSLCSWSSVLPHHPNSVPSASIWNGDENRGQVQKMAIPRVCAKWVCLCVPLWLGGKCWEDIYAIGKWHRAGRGCKPQGKQDSVRAWCFRKTNSLKIEFVSKKLSKRFYTPQTWPGEVPQKTQGLHLATGWMSPQCCVLAKQPNVLWECMNCESFQFWG